MLVARNFVSRLIITVIALVVAVSAMQVSTASNADVSAGHTVGRGISDVTGESAGSDKYGYLSPVKTKGISQRLWSRAFIIVDNEVKRRVAFVVVDINTVDGEIRKDVLKRLRHRYGQLYNQNNVLLTATHTHSSPGGYMHYNMTNLGTPGFRPKTYRAIVDGVVDSIVRAHADLQPGTLELSSGVLNNASVNRSRAAFNRNPKADREYFPDAIDPHSVVLLFKQAGRPVGAINWFGTHGTSMTRHGLLVNGDNKGYAAYLWEKKIAGIDYLAKTAPAFVAAFAQSNSGDITPNLDLHEGEGPTKNDKVNTAIIGGRQFSAARRAIETGTALTGVLDYRFAFVDLSKVLVAPKFSGTNKVERTCSGALGTGFAAGSKEDGPGLDFLNEGTGVNPVFDAINSTIYSISPALKACQAPKSIAIPSGDIKFTPNILPIQLLRIGQLYLLAPAQEITIVAGLRLRQTVAAIVGAPLENVLVSSLSNDFAGYVTTPEEYLEGDYEAGHTMFGRWTLPAYQQLFAGMAQDMVAGRRTNSEVYPPDVSNIRIPSLPDNSPDWQQPGTHFGDVVQQPDARYSAGQTVRARFIGANPNNNLNHGWTYLAVERWDGSRWVRKYDDNDWSTAFSWSNRGPLAPSMSTATWHIPNGATAGTYRIVYYGHSRSLDGKVLPFVGKSRNFTVNESA